MNYLFQTAPVESMCEDASLSTTADADVDNDDDEQRIQLSNLPSNMSFKQMKMFIEKKFAQKSVKKLRHIRDVAYMSFDSTAEAMKAIETLDGYTMKGRVLRAKLAPREPKKGIECRVCDFVIHLSQNIILFLEIKR